eukprot:g49616.t1
MPFSLAHRPFHMGCYHWAYVKRSIAFDHRTATRPPSRSWRVFHPVKFLSGRSRGVLGVGREGAVWFCQLHMLRASGKNADAKGLPNVISEEQPKRRRASSALCSRPSSVSKRHRCQLLTLNFLDLAWEANNVKGAVVKALQETLAPETKRAAQGICMLRDITAEIPSDQFPQVIKTLLQADVVPILLHTMDQAREADPTARAALWTLLNISALDTSSNWTLIQAGASSQLCGLLSHNDPELADMSLWTISNLLSGGKDIQEMLLRDGVFEKAVALASRYREAGEELRTLRRLVAVLYTLSTAQLARTAEGAPLLESSLPKLVSAFESWQDQQVLCSVARLFRDLTYQSHLSAVLEAGLADQLAAMLAEPSLGEPLLFMLLQAILSLLNRTGPNNEMEYWSKAKLWKGVKPLLSHSRHQVRLSACIMVGHLAQFRLSSASPDLNALESQLEQLAISDTEPAELRKTATWAINRLSSGGVLIPARNTNVAA